MAASVTPRHDMLVGLHVIDEAIYNAYRAAMRPILQRYRGGFRYDFKVAETLLSETDTEINRVFIISFPSERSERAFFADPECGAVRAEYFVKSVQATTFLGVVKP